MSKNHREFVLSKRTLNVRFKRGCVYCRKCDCVVSVGDRVVTRAVDHRSSSSVNSIYHKECWEACFI
jgi:hypothetical protein